MTEGEINDLWSVQPSGNVPGGQAEMILNQLIPKFNEPQFTSKSMKLCWLKANESEMHISVSKYCEQEIELEILPHHPIDLISLNVLLPEVEIDG